MKHLFRIACLVALSGCVAEGPASSGRFEKLSAEIAQFQSNPAIIEFLATEATNAGVREIRGFEDSHPDAIWGSSDSKGIIRLNTAKAGGTSVVNITHEIAHAASDYAGTCGGHGTRWLAAYVTIAERYEARFPGSLWSSRRPVDRVMVNKTRYSIGTQCR